ncbi:hypothetical protein NDU88_005309 [Pleurodeles waltl]|uniref:Uncharacterized protein n=1 Tax=Pleurodeles waltl TaxID=8319 RepID=A0AAV7NR54_PLEWA|nr:hypothetical protein NDU88_005309 [Pleurodeles waltl]
MLQVRAAGFSYAGRERQAGTNKESRFLLQAFRSSADGLVVELCQHGPLRRHRQNADSTETRRLLAVHRVRAAGFSYAGRERQAGTNKESRFLLQAFRSSADSLVVELCQPGPLRRHRQNADSTETRRLLAVHRVQPK